MSYSFGFVLSWAGKRAAAPSQLGVRQLRPFRKVCSQAALCKRCMSEHVGVQNCGLPFCLSTWCLCGNHPWPRSLVHADKPIALLQDVGLDSGFMVYRSTNSWSHLVLWSRNHVSWATDSPIAWHACTIRCAGSCHWSHSGPTEMLPSFLWVSSTSTLRDVLY